MLDRSLARYSSGETAKCHEIWRLRAMLSGGFTGQLLGVFMKAVEVRGCYIRVERVFREWYEMQLSRVVMCQDVGGHQGVNAT